MSSARPLPKRCARFWRRLTSSGVMGVLPCPRTQVLARFWRLTSLSAFTPCSP